MLMIPSTLNSFKKEYYEKLKLQREIFVNQLVRREGADVVRDELRGKIIMIDDAIEIMEALIYELYSERNPTCN